MYYKLIKQLSIFNSFCSKNEFTKIKKIKYYKTCLPVDDTMCLALFLINKY